MKELKLLKSIFTKQAILYTVNLYMDKINYKIDDDGKNFILKIENQTEDEINFLEKELNFNSLRFEIADNNKELRKSIISQALWSINVE